MKRMLIALVAVAATLSLYAVDAGWSNEDTAVQVWTTAANWTNVTDGTTLAAPPTGADDTVAFPFVDPRMRTVTFCGNVDAVSGSFGVASVTGPQYWTLQMPGYSAAGSNAQRTFTVGDVNGFKGAWQMAGPFQTVALTASSGVQTLETLSAQSRPIIDVRNAAVEAKVNLVRDAGAVEKKGPGKLTLGVMHDASQDVYLDKGVLELTGSADDLSALFAKAVAHLDASRADTMKGYTGEDGRHYVTNWAHASGGTVGAELWDNSADKTPSHIKRPHAPFLNSDAVASTGLPLMDFGAVTETGMAQYGPTNCTLRFSTFLRGVREVFYVDMHSDPLSSSNYSLCLDNPSSSIFSGNDTYAFKYQYDATLNGDVRFNGIPAFPVWASEKYQYKRPCDVYSPTWDSLTLTSVGLASAINLYHLCADQLYAYPSGGMRIGEILIFTDELTVDERREINAYLMRKWFAATPKTDVQTLHVANDDTVAVSVPAGRTARIENVVLKGRKLVKTGEGLLEIGAIEPRDATVEIRAGRVKVTSTASEISDNLPAGTPLFWYDGDADGAFEETGGRVSKWNDRRSGLSRPAVSMTDRDLPLKELVTINGKDHTVVDFGGSGNSGSYMNPPYRKDDSTVACQKESFVVICFKGSSQLYPIFGTYNAARNSRGWFNVLSPSACADDWGGASATVNGVPIDPFGASDSADSIWQNDVWYVVSLAGNTSGEGFARRLGGDYATGRNGQVKIGEYIGYDKGLTPEERRNTVAYLMKKWLNKDHPDAEDRGVPAYDYPSDQPVRITSDDDITIRSCTGGNGTVVKEGAGRATFAGSIGSYTDLTVESGELAFAKVAFEDKSYLHFDASDTSSFVTTYVDETGATNVSRWADTRGNGAYGGPYGGAASQCYGTNPVVRIVETRPGVFRQVLDFLNARNRADSQTYKDCAAMLFDGSHRPNNIVEAYTIFSDAHGYKSGLTFGTHLDQHFYRGVNGAWVRDWAVCAPVVNGYLAVDGEQVAYNHDISDGFHLLSVIPSKNVSVTGFGMSSANDWSGGFYVGEMLAFTTPLTSVERTYLQQSLMRKWFGDTVPVPEWTNEVASVAVAADAKMTFASGSVVVTPALTGSGTISAAGVAGVESLSLETADGLPVAKEIEGKVAFAPAVTLTLGEGLRRIPAGTYTLLTATDILGADEANWTIVSDASDRRVLKVVAEGNVLKLCVEKKGMVMVVR